MILVILKGLLNQLGIIVLAAFILSRSRFFKNYILKENLTLYDKVLFAVVFGLVGIGGTYAGVPINDAIANSRSIGVVVAGLLGGPFVGIGAGLIAGIHRMLITTGRFTAIACGISTILGGVIAGYAKKYVDHKQDKWLFAALVAAIIETLQMGVILLVARPFDQALLLVEIIFIPMTFINSLGTGAFILLIQQIYDEKEKAGAMKAQLALSIATKTLPYFRKGLNFVSAEKTAKIIHESTKVAAVSLTDNEKILAFVGAGKDHHKTGGHIRTRLTKRAIQEGRFMVAHEKSAIECFDKKCPLKSVIVVPLLINEQVTGTLKLYKKVENSITSSDVELAKGLGHLFSTQLELSQLDYQNKLLSKAELKALQAQIQPHFLFNALNTIVSFCRTDPSKARELLLKLSYYLRTNFKNIGDYIPIKKELEYVKAFLYIEKARFGERLVVKFEEDGDINCNIPPLILQPIVENALKHGLLPKKTGGSVVIRVARRDDHVKITVIDDGVGMSKDEVRCLLDHQCKKEGIGVSNVHKRLESIYGQGLHIESNEGQGTKVSMIIPVVK
ncbi:sensor histidine kinase [Vallitalea okinawensis]|uniref:sensor histidine kinase n=1 Tax=Vallitalea okinawensis TaxID=2078660 RepID=UPI000CFBA715|nr:sensor histidine kinase [Vallitalea okinawensis]